MHKRNTPHIPAALPTRKQHRLSISPIQSGNQTNTETASLQHITSVQVIQSGSYTNMEIASLQHIIPVLVIHSGSFTNKETASPQNITPVQVVHSGSQTGTGTASPLHLNTIPVIHMLLPETFASSSGRNAKATAKSFFSDPTKAMSSTRNFDTSPHEAF